MAAPEIPMFGTKISIPVIMIIVAIRAPNTVGLLFSCPSNSDCFSIVIEVGIIARLIIPNIPRSVNSGKKNGVTIGNNTAAEIPKPVFIKR